MNKNNSDFGVRCHIASGGAPSGLYDAKKLRELAQLLVKWQHAERAKRANAKGRAA